MAGHVKIGLQAKSGRPCCCTRGPRAWMLHPNAKGFTMFLWASKVRVMCDVSCMCRLPLTAGQKRHAWLRLVPFFETMTSGARLLGMVPSAAAQTRQRSCQSSRLQGWNCVVPACAAWGREFAGSATCQGKASTARHSWRQNDRFSGLNRSKKVVFYRLIIKMLGAAISALRLPNLAACHRAGRCIGIISSFPHMQDIPRG